jgi:enoyl-CoA hydratase/2-(1,2-epoxy-1,2-dihydrophenyl)acetyl-CoA isomerase
MHAGSDVAFSFAGETAQLRLSRPAARNAIRTATLDELDAHLRPLRDEPAVRTLVLCAEPPAFCAGVDLDEAERLAGAPRPQRSAFVERLQDLTRLLRSLPQVTIAAVDGAAVGLGAELAIACDLRFAGDGARFRFPELRRGLFPTNGVTVLLPALVGAGRAQELLLGGGWIDADVAGAIGLARRVAGSASVAAVAFADGLKAGDPRATRLATRALRSTTHDQVEAALVAESASAVELNEHEA